MFQALFKGEIGFVLKISGMMLQYLLPQGGHVDVGVDFGGADALVAQQCLDDTQVGAAL